MAKLGDLSNQAILEVLILDRASAAAAKIATSADAMSASFDKTEATAKKSQTALNALTNQFTALARQAGVVVEAQLSLSRATDVLDRAMQHGLATQSQANQILQQLSEKMQINTAQTIAAGTAMEQLAAKYSKSVAGTLEFNKVLAETTLLLDAEEIALGDAASALARVIQQNSTAVISTDNLTQSQRQLIFAAQALAGEVTAAAAAQAKLTKEQEQASAAIEAQHAALRNAISGTIEAQADEMVATNEATLAMQEQHEQLRLLIATTMEASAETARWVATADGIKLALDPAIAAELKYAEAVGLANGAQERGLITQRQRIAYIEAEASAMNAQKVQVAARQLGGLPSVESGPSSSISEHTAALDSVISKYGAATDAAAKYAKQEALLQEAFAAGRIEQSGLTRGLADAAKALEGVGTGATGVSGKTREFAVLIRELLRGDLSRLTGSLILETQQMGLLGAAIGFLTSPMGIMLELTAAIIFANYRYAESMKAVSDSYKVYGGSLGLSREELERMAQATAKQGAVGIKDVRTVQTAALSSGSRLTGSQLGQVQDLSLGYSRAFTDGDLKKAAVDLAHIFQDPTKAAQELEQATGLLGPTLLRMVEDLDAAGDTAKAADLVLAKLKPTLVDVADNGLNYFGKAVHDAKEEFNSFWDNLGHKVAPPTLSEQLKIVQDEITRAGRESKYGSSFDAFSDSIFGKDTSGRPDLAALRQHEAELQKRIADGEAADRAKGVSDAQSLAMEKVLPQARQHAGNAEYLTLQNTVKDAQAAVDAAQAQPLAKGGEDLRTQLEQRKELNEYLGANKRAMDSWITTEERESEVAAVNAKAVGMLPDARAKFITPLLAEIAAKGVAITGDVAEARSKTKLTETLTALTAEQIAAARTAQIAADATGRLAAAAGLGGAAQREAAEANEREAAAKGTVAEQLAVNIKYRYAERDAITAYVNETVRGLDHASDSNDRMAEAIMQGTDAVAAATKADYMEAAARELRTDKTKNLIQVEAALKAIDASYDRNAASTTDKGNSELLKPQQDKIALLKEELALGSANANVRAVEIAGLQAASDFDNRRVGTNKEGRELYIQQAEAAQALEIALGRAVERQQELQAASQKTVEAVTDTVATMFDTAFNRTKNSWRDMWQQMGQDAKQQISKTLADLLVKPAMTSLVDGISGQPAPASTPLNGSGTTMGALVALLSPNPQKGSLGDSLGITAQYGTLTNLVGPNAPAGSLAQNIAALLAAKPASTIPALPTSTPGVSSIIPLEGVGSSQVATDSGNTINVNGGTSAAAQIAQNAAQASGNAQGDSAVANAIAGGGTSALGSLSQLASVVSTGSAISGWLGGPTVGSALSSGLFGTAPSTIAGVSDGLGGVTSSINVAGSSGLIGSGGPSVSLFGTAPTTAGGTDGTAGLLGAGGSSAALSGLGAGIAAGILAGTSNLAGSRLGNAAVGGLSGGLAAAGTIEVLGGGPEDPFADVAAALAVIAGAIAGAVTGPPSVGSNDSGKVSFNSLGQPTASAAGADNGGSFAGAISMQQSVINTMNQIQSLVGPIADLPTILVGNFGAKSFGTTTQSGLDTSNPASAVYNSTADATANALLTAFKEDIDNLPPAIAAAVNAMPIGTSGSVFAQNIAFASQFQATITALTTAPSGQSYTNQAVVTQQAADQQLTDQLNQFVTNATAAGQSTSEASAAVDTYVQNMLKMPPVITTLQQQISTLQGQFGAFSSVIQNFSGTAVTATQAYLEAQQGLANALAPLIDTFNEATQEAFQATLAGGSGLNTLQTAMETLGTSYANLLTLTSAQPDGGPPAETLGQAAPAYSEMQGTALDTVDNTLNGMIGNTLLLGQAISAFQATITANTPGVTGANAALFTLATNSLAAAKQILSTGEAVGTAGSLAAAQASSASGIEQLLTKLLTSSGSPQSNFANAKGLYQQTYALAANAPGTLVDSYGNPLLNADGTPMSAAQAKSAGLSGTAETTGEQQTALGNVAQSAQTYLQSAGTEYATGSQYQQAASTVENQLGTLPVVETWYEKMNDALGLIQVSTGNTVTQVTEIASNTLNGVNVILSDNVVVSAIDKAATTIPKGSATYNLIMGANGILNTYNAVVAALPGIAGADTGTPAYNLVMGADSSVENTFNVAVLADFSQFATLDKTQKAVITGGEQTYTTDVEVAMSNWSTLTTPQQNTLAAVNNSYATTQAVLFDSASWGSLNTSQQNALIAANTSYTTSVGVAFTNMASLTVPEQNALTAANNAYSTTQSMVFHDWDKLTATQQAAILAQDTAYTNTLTQSISGITTDPNAIAMLNAFAKAPSGGTASLTQALTQDISASSTSVGTTQLSFTQKVVQAIETYDATTGSSASAITQAVKQTFTGSIESASGVSVNVSTGAMSVFDNQVNLSVQQIVSFWGTVNQYKNAVCVFDTYTQTAVLDVGTTLTNIIGTSTTDTVQSLLTTIVDTTYSSAVYLGTIESNLKQQNTSAGIKAYAAGGAFSGGYRIVGEQGPELEYTGPSQILSNPQSRALFGASNDNSQLTAMLSQQTQVHRFGYAALLSELQGLRSSNVAMQQTLAKMQQSSSANRQRAFVS